MRLQVTVLGLLLGLGGAGCTVASTEPVFTEKPLVTYEKTTSLSEPARDPSWPAWPAGWELVLSEACDGADLIVSGDCSTTNAAITESAREGSFAPDLGPESWACAMRPTIATQPSSMTLTITCGRAKAN